MGLRGTARTNSGPWYMGRNGKGGSEMEGNVQREKVETRLSTEYLENSVETGLSQSGDK